MLCCFLLFSLCGGWLSSFVCAGGSSGTGGMDCVLEDVSHTMLFSVALCVWQFCVQWGFKRTGSVDCVLEVVSKFMLFSVA